MVDPDFGCGTCSVEDAKDIHIEHFREIIRGEIKGWFDNGHARVLEYRDVPLGFLDD